MSPRLPTPGADAGNWGSILNDFLEQEHNEDGSLKNVARPSELATVSARVDGSLKADGSLKDQIVSRSALATGVAVALLPGAGQDAIIEGRALFRLSNGDPIEVKPNTDKAAGIFNWIHNSDTGYIMHLMNQASTTQSTALIGMGLDAGAGNGLLIANKSASAAKGIVIDQRATKTDTQGYGFHATQRSPAAPLMRLEMQANDAAAVLQLLAFGTPGAGQQLLYVGDPSGEAGRINAVDGKIMWRRSIQMRDKDVSTISRFDATENSGVTDNVARHAMLSQRGLEIYWPTGTAGSWWPYRIGGQGSALNIQAGGSVSTVDSDPTMSTIIQIKNNAIGFFGTSATTKATITGSRADGTALANLLSELAAKGLITNSTTA